MIVIDRTDLKISVELGPAPPDPARYVAVIAAGVIDPIRLTAAEANALADALHAAAKVGRLVE